MGGKTSNGGSRSSRATKGWSRPVRAILGVVLVILSVPLFGLMLLGVANTQKGSVSTTVVIVAVFVIPAVPLVAGLLLIWRAVRHR